jgi:hypothetical protein
MRPVPLDLCSKDGSNLNHKANPKRTIVIIIILKEVLTNESYV